MTPKRGFTFTCPHLRMPEDADFERFVKTYQNQPNKVHNPFPQLVCRNNLYQARTNPLIRATYLPCTDMDSYFSTPAGRLTMAHEMWHSEADCTPLKLMARILYIQQVVSRLDSILTFIEAMSKHHIRDLELGVGLRIILKEFLEEYVESVNELLSSLANSIALSEELVVTAGSLYNRLETGNDLYTLMKYTLAEQRKSFPKFSKYYPAFKKAFVLKAEEADVSEGISWLIFALQALVLEDHRPRGNPCEECDRNHWFIEGLGFCLAMLNYDELCKRAAKSIKAMNNWAEVMNWIKSQEFMAQMADAYPFLIGRLSVLVKDLPEAGWVVTLLMGRKFRSDCRDYFKSLRHSELGGSARVTAYLYPEELDGEWFIRRWSWVPPPIGRRRQRTQETAVIHLLEGDSIWQQLAAREGFNCLYYTPKRCVCSTEKRKTLTTLCQVANKGGFGEGLWKDLPSQCTLTT